MEERKGGLWLGAAAIWRSGATSVASEFTAATGDAEGKRFKLELNREFRAKAVTITPRIGAEWYDKDYVDYYYGVRANEARADRRAYRGDSSQAIEAGVRFGYAWQRGLLRRTDEKKPRYMTGQERQVNEFRPLAGCGALR